MAKKSGKAELGLSEAVREALAKLGTSATEPQVRAYLADNHQQHADSSSLASTLSRLKGKGKRGRDSDGGEPSMSELLAVKKVIDDQYGGMKEVEDLLFKVGELERAAGGRAKLDAVVEFWSNALGK